MTNNTRVILKILKKATSLMQNIVIKERGEESIKRKNIGVEQELVEVIILVTGGRVNNNDNLKCF